METVIQFVFYDFIHLLLLYPDCCSRAAPVNFFVPNAALIRGRRLIEGGAYSSKYGIILL